MAERKAFLLRLDPAIHDAVQRWAATELRSVNAQIEFLLRRALAERGRLPVESAASTDLVTDDPGTENPPTSV